MVSYREYTMRLFAVQSLKDKRSLRLRLIHQLKKQFQVACAEVDAMDALDRLVIGVAAVANDGHHLEERMQSVETYIEEYEDAELIEVIREPWQN